MKININFKQSFLLLFITVYLYDILSCLVSENAAIYNLICLMFLVLYLLIFYPKNVFNVFKKKKNIYFILFLVLIFVSGIFSLQINSVINRLFSMVNMLFSIFIFDFINSLNDKKINKYIFYIYNIIMIILCIKTIQVLIEYPTLARSMTSDWAVNNEIMKGMSIGGGYYLVYSLLFVVINYFIIFIDEKAKINIPMLTLIMLFVFTIFFSQFTIALVILIVSSLVIIFRKVNKQSILLLLLAVTIMCSFSSNIIEFIDETVYKDKIIEILTFDKSGQNVDARLSRIIRSTETFIAYPIIGVSYKTGFDFYEETEYVGTHSDFFDTFARYGLFSTLILYMGLYRNFKAYKISNLVLFFFILVSILNPVFNAPIFLSIFLYSNIANDYFDIKHRGDK